MKHLPEDYIIRNVSTILKKSLLLAFFSISFMGYSFSQTIGVSQCNCSNDPLVPDSLRFTDVITITSDAGETWQVTTNTGLYDTSVPPVLIAAGASFMETSPGNYSLTGTRINGIAYMFTATNNLGEIVSNAGLNMSNCIYPPDTIMGAAFACIESTEDYTIDNADLSTVNWTISGGGTITTATDGFAISVDWSAVQGTYTLSAIGETNAGCMFDLSLDVTLENIIPLACNNLVHVSLSDDCLIELSPDDILEDFMFANDSYTITITDPKTGNEYPNGTIGSDFTGDTLEISVIHLCGGNSCWGKIVVEDKSVPALVCSADVTIDCDELTGPELNGFPLPMGSSTPVLLSDGSYLVAGFDNCGDAFLTYSDEQTTADCSDPDFSSVITRTWLVTDEFGATSSCSQQIFITRSGIADITFPDNWDSATPGGNNSIEACTNFPKLPNGAPSPEFTGSPEGTICFNVDISYEDTVLPICGDNAFKVIRKWTAIDHCANPQVIVTHTQLITVMDNLLVCTAPPEFSVDAAPHLCVGPIDVPAPNVVGECSEWDYFVSFKLRADGQDPFTQPSTDGVIRNGDGTYTVTNLPNVQDSVWIIYTVEDACGNICQAFTEVSINDTEEPTPVCDLYTFVALNENGMAFAGVETFDDGSFDNCGVADITIRRMNNNGCTQPGDPYTVKFCCQDLGSTHLVALTVTDEAGFTNSCMVQVEVQDNQGPVFSSCPADVTVDCQTNFTNLDQFGSASADDTCGATVTNTSTENFTTCGNGVITRTFTAEDNAGNTAVCIQTITVRDLNQFSRSDIRFPNDFNTTGCGGPNGIDPSISGDIRVTTTPCSDVVHSYNDVVFQYVDEACYKILREWTVIDWCQRNPFLPDAGVWRHTQTIKITNSSAPQLTAGCSNQTFDEDFNSVDCTSNISLGASATDDCTDSADLDWSYSIDAFNDGSIDITGNTNDASGSYPFGTHEICWTVADECGNESSCCSLFTVVDAKPPTPYCLDGVVVVIDQDSNSGTIWATDFINGTVLDNCTASTQIRISFSTDVNDISRSYTCADIANGVVDTLEMNIYFTDLSGNSDFCTSTLIIQDNQNVCTDVDTPTGGSDLIEIQGMIYSDKDERVEDVEIMLMTENIGDFTTQMTPSSGEYAFQDLGMYNDYMIQPTKDTEHTNGVTTLDLVIIQKHILGIQQLASPYKMIAADINQSSSISALDLLELRKLILGIYSELPNNTSYKFIPADFEFANQSNPFPFEEDMYYSALDHDVLNSDFIAVKIGDVNGSASYSLVDNNNDTKSASKQILTKKEVNANTWAIAVSESLETPGFQMTLVMDYTDNVTINSLLPGFSAANYSSKNNAGKTYVNIAYHSDSDLILEAGDNLFTINKASRSASLEIASKGLNAEIYTAGLDQYETHSLILKDAINTTQVDTAFELMQNVPNPFDNTTTIGFNLPESGEVTLKIFDTTGKTVFMTERNLQSGYNQISLDKNHITKSGILYYQLETATHIASKKMIAIK